jgi:hypothetical protein
MNERCATAHADPIARADSTLNPKFWKRMCVDGRWLSTIVTLNK